MGTPLENAKAITLYTYSLFYELLGIDDQIKRFPTIKREFSSQTAGIEDNFFIVDAHFNIQIKTTNDGKWNYVKITLPGKEFKSFKLENDLDAIYPEFKEVVKPQLKPMIDYIKSRLNS